jgi:NDP-sugar pyrophosphorylase family protein
VVLAAGRGSRLRPLTDLLPKPLCPVGNVALLDWAIGRIRLVTDAVALNVHHGRRAIEEHVGASGGHVHLSVEEDRALGTAGALAHLRGWLDGRAVLATNADAWGPLDVGALVDGWDGERVRVLVVPDDQRPDFRLPVAGRGGGWRFAGTSLQPWSAVAGLRPEPSGLYESVWQPALDQGRLELVPTDQPFFDCGTPSEYLAANLAWSGGVSVVGPDAQVDGEVIRSVVWPGAVVRAGERLVECIRADGLTVPAPLRG